MYVLEGGVDNDDKQPHPKVRKERNVMKFKQGCQCSQCKEVYDAGFYVGHKSDCKVHNGPAYTKGECDCIFKNLQLSITCPFCGEDDMDARGFKIHLISGHCEVFEMLDREVGCDGCMYYPQDQDEHPCHECSSVNISGNREKMSEYKSKY